MSESMKLGDPASGNGDVAIIGMACIFPKAPDLRTYWQNILARVNAIGDPPEDRRMDEFFDPEPGAKYKTYCKKGGYLERPPRFNPLEHGIMPVAIDGAEPEHFLALQVAHDALVDAGFPEKPLNRERTEVILGRGTYVSRGLVTVLHHGAAIHLALDLLKKLHPEYSSQELEAIEEQLRSSVPPFSSETAPGLVPSVMAGLVANRLNLRGANYVVDAACASALVAAEIGVQDLLSGKCDAVLTGAVQASAPSFMNILFARLGALTHHSELHPFAEDADGTMIGEGIGMMVLKRRIDAERDGHRIYALIKGVGSSSDGRARGILAPRVEGEELALRRAYEAAGVHQDTIGLLEAHGTGLPLGDLTEIEAIGNVFGSRDGGYPRCAMGTVKSMIGHLLPAAGIAGIIKTALALHHGILPPTLRAAGSNPKPEIEKTVFYLNTETRPWIHGAPDFPRRAGVNAFGFGGINAHAVLEEHDGGNQWDSESLLGRWDTELCVLQAESRHGLIEQARQLLSRLRETSRIDLLELARSLAGRPLQEPCRLSIVASSAEDLENKLTHVVKRLEDEKRRQVKDKSGIYFFEDPLARDGRLAFLFPGEGSQYPHMLADLCLHFPQARSCFDTLDRAFAGRPGETPPSLRIFPLPDHHGRSAPGEEDLWQMDHAVDAVLTADRAMHEVLGSLEIHPQVILGHSSGEIMALEAAGAIQLSGEEERREHILAGNAMIRSFFTEVAMPEAHLVAVGGTGRDKVAEVVREDDGKVFVAMENCPHQVVLCCRDAVLEAVMERLRKTGALCQVLPFARPYHTPLFEPGRRSLEAFFDRVELSLPKVEMYSCVNAKPMPRDRAEVRKLVVGQWARPVRFQETIESMYGAGVRLFLEVGPKANLTSFVGDVLKGKPHLAVASNVHYRSGTTQLNHALGLLAAHGVPMRLDPLYRRRTTSKPDWERTSEAEMVHGSGETTVKISLGLPMPSLDGLEKPSNARGQSTGGGKLFGGETTGAGPAFQKEGSLDEEEGHKAPAVPQWGRLSTLLEGGPDRHLQGSRSQVMEEYFQTMEEFLSAQEEIMSAYLGDEQSSWAPLEAALDPSQSAASLDGQAGSHVGIPGSHGSTVGEVTIPEVSAPPLEPNPPPASPDFPRTQNSRIANLLVTLVSERTGYPTEMLKPDQDLEADLGIDSIKRVEILGAMARHLGSFDEGQVEHLSRLKTMGEIIGFLESPREMMSSNTDAASIPPGHEGLTALPGGSHGESLEQPFAGQVIRMVPRREILVRRVLDMNRDLFLRDHTLGGNVSKYDPDLLALPVMPFAMSIEMMAEAASRLSPGQVLARASEVMAYDWIVMQGEKLEVEIQARRVSDSSETLVHVRIPATEQHESKLVMEAVLIFESSYPEPQAVEGLALEDEIPCRIPPEQIYPQALFHGPSFQSVREVKRCGSNALEASIATPSPASLVRDMASPQFLSNPVLLDGAGQAVGLWAAHTLETDFVVFPVGVSQIRFFRSMTIPPKTAECRVRATLEGDSLILSDVHLIDGNGAPALHLRGLRHRRIKMPRAVHLFRGSRDILLSTPWQAPLEGLENPGPMVCCRFDSRGMDFNSSDGRVMRNVIAHIVLSRRERETWTQLRGTEKRRTEWLMARVAGKEAVRLLLGKVSGIDVWPADIEILRDPSGKPTVAGMWCREIAFTPQLSLTHSQGVAVALAGSGQNMTGVGIDMEFLGKTRRVLDNLAFTPGEREIIDRTGAKPGERAMRIWCAKEAVGKALGLGLPGGPRDLTALGLDDESGMVIFEISGKLAKELPHLSGETVKVHTYYTDELVVAIARYENGGLSGRCSEAD